MSIECMLLVQKKLCYERNIPNLSLYFTRRDSLRSYIHVFIATSPKGIVY